MFKRLKELWINYRKLKILKEWNYNDVLRRQYYAELFYRTWANGWLSGYGKGDPVEAWKGMAEILGVEYPIKPEIVQLFDAQNKGVGNEQAEGR